MILKAFTSNGIIPDVIDVPPNETLGVTFKQSSKTVNLGNELKPSEVQKQPQLNYTFNAGSYYTVIFVDPDAPSRAQPILREFLHWLVGNIPGSDVSSGKVIVDFMGSAPPMGSGLHRYTLLVFKQPTKIDFVDPVLTLTAGLRGKFSTKRFVAKYKLGTPISGNFYLAQFDNSVPGLIKQLGL